MDKIAEIKRKLREAVGIELNYPVRGTVEAVDGQTCSVKLETGLIVTSVRLKAVINESDDFLLLTPVIGSDVLMISGSGNLDDLTVIKVDQVQKIEICKGGLTVLFDGDDGKVSVKNSNTSLKAIFEVQAKFLKELTVSTSTGPSGVPLPATQTAISQWEQLINQLLK